jgi:hypothetical protein
MNLIPKFLRRRPAPQLIVLPPPPPPIEPTIPLTDSHVFQHFISCDDAQPQIGQAVIVLLDGPLTTMGVDVQDDEANFALHQRRVQQIALGRRTDFYQEKFMGNDNVYLRINSWEIAQLPPAIANDEFDVIAWKPI